MADYSAGLDRTVLDSYMDLPSDGRVQCMYIWIDGSGENVRCKTKTCAKVPERPEGWYTKQIRNGNISKYCHQFFICFEINWCLKYSDMINCDTFNAETAMCQNFICIRAGSKHWAYFEFLVKCHYWSKRDLIFL